MVEHDDVGPEVTPDPDGPAYIEQVRALEEEVLALRRRLQDAPKRVRTLEERLLETKGQLAQAVAQNEKLTYTLREARDHIAALREEVDKLTQPPSAYGTLLGGQRRRHRRRVLRRPQDAGGGAPRARRRRAACAAARSSSTSRSTSCWPARPRPTARSSPLKEILEDGRRAIIVGRADEERVVDLSDGLVGSTLRSGDSVLMDPRSGLLLEKLPRPEVEELVLEEVPDISYDDIGGLDDQIEQIADAVELPFLHQDLFAEHKLPAPKGILLYGPPGCGKTLIAKAVANSLAKKVGAALGRRGTPRATSSTSRAPSCSTSTWARPSGRSAWSSSGPARSPRRAGRSSSSSTRWTRCSAPAAPASAPTSSRRSSRSCWPRSTASSRCKNVIVIGASNREDLIDPAILRPGRLDVKIKIERPNETAAAQIFARYLTADLPLDADDVREPRRRRRGTSASRR